MINLVEIIKKSLDKQIEKAETDHSKELLDSFKNKVESGEIFEYKREPLTINEKEDLLKKIEFMATLWDSLVHEKDWKTKFETFEKIRKLSIEIGKKSQKTDFEESVKSFVRTFSNPLKETTIYQKTIFGRIYFDDEESSINSLHREEESLFYNLMRKRYEKETLEVFELKTVGGKIKRLERYREYVMDSINFFKERYPNINIVHLDYTDTIDLNIKILQNSK